MRRPRPMSTKPAPSHGKPWEKGGKIRSKCKA